MGIWFKPPEGNEQAKAAMELGACFANKKNTAYGNWHMAQSWPKKHQLQRSDFPQNYFAIQ